MVPKILITIYGGVIQTIASDPHVIEVEVLDFDCNQHYELPESWRPLVESIFGADIPEEVGFHE